MSKKIHTEAVDHLFEAVLCLENKEECYTFFEDVPLGMNYSTFMAGLKKAGIELNRKMLSERLSVSL